MVGLDFSMHHLTTVIENSTHWLSKRIKLQSQTGIQDKKVLRKIAARQITAADFEKEAYELTVKCKNYLSQRNKIAALALSGTVHSLLDELQPRHDIFLPKTRNIIVSYLDTSELGLLMSEDTREAITRQFYKMFI